jgi:hypothetical protein
MNCVRACQSAAFAHRNARVALVRRSTDDARLRGLVDGPDIGARRVITEEMKGRDQHLGRRGSSAIFRWDGPVQRLRELGIDAQLDLPAVDRNLPDYPLCVSASPPGGEPSGPPRQVRLAARSSPRHHQSTAPTPLPGACLTAARQHLALARNRESCPVRRTLSRARGSACPMGNAEIEADDSAT